MDRTVAAQTWQDLANAIDEIYKRNASKLSFEELYRKAYNLVLHKHGTLLYDGVTDKLSSHLLETVNRLAETQDSSLLEEVASTWNEHQVRKCHYTDSRFAPMNLTHICRQYTISEHRRSP